MNQLPRRVRTKVRAEGRRAWAHAHPEEAAAEKRAAGPSITVQNMEAAPELDVRTAPATTSEPSTSPDAALETARETGLPNPPLAPKPAPLEEPANNKKRHRDLRDYLERAESTSETPARASDSPACQPASSTQDAVTKQVYAELMECDSESIVGLEDSLQTAGQASTSPNNKL